MATSTEVLTAIKELAANKQLDRENLLDLLRDGIHAALVKKYGPTVRSEIDIDEDGIPGAIIIVDPVNGALTTMTARQVLALADGSGSTLDLSALASWSDASQISSLTVKNSGTVLASSLASFSGVAIVLGPGWIEDAHKPTERIAIAELERAVGIYGRFLARRDLPVGHLVGEEDVRLVDWPVDALPDGYTRSIAEVVGRGLIQGVQLNEPLLETKLAGRGTGGGLPIVAGGALLCVTGFGLILFMPEHGFSPKPRAERSTWRKMWGTFRDGLAMVRGSTKAPQRLPAQLWETRSQQELFSSPWP